MSLRQKRPRPSFALGARDGPRHLNGGHATGTDRGLDE